MATGNQAVKEVTPMSSPWDLIDTEDLKLIKKEKPKRAKKTEVKVKGTVRKRQKQISIIKNADGNIRALFILQPSSVKNGKKFILSGDSNWNISLRGFIPQIIKQKGWHWYITVPHPKDVDGDYKGTKHDDETFYYQMCHPMIAEDPEMQKQVTFVIMPYERNAWMSRFMFSTDAWKAFFKKYTDIDVIWCNYPELLRNLKTAMLALGVQGATTITGFYWVDNKFHRRIHEDISYSFRQIDGALTADIPTFAAPAVRDDFLEGMKEYFNEFAVEKVREKAVLWDLGASYSEIQDQFYTDSSLKRTSRGRLSHHEIDDESWVILFPNRVRSYTNYKGFMKAINTLAEERDDVVAIMTAPDMNTKQEVLQKSCPALQIVTNKSREDYLRILHRTDFVVSLFRKELYGGCATREAMVAGAIPITHDAIAWKYMFKKYWHGFIKNNLSNFTPVIEKLMKDNELRVYHQNEVKEVIKNFCYEFIVDKIVADIESKLEFSDNDLKWAGYVKDAIIAAKNKDFNDIKEQAHTDMFKQVGQIDYPIPKDQLNSLLFARSKSELLIDYGNDKTNHWPFGNKDWFTRIRRAMFKELNVVDDTSRSIATYRLDD